MKFFTIPFVFACIFTFSLSAQTSSLSSVDYSHQIINSEDWSFFSDNETRVLFIDFEKIKVNLSDITVKNTTGEVVFKEDVWQLPVNTIFEIDYSSFRPGKYQIEIRSFTGMIRREFSVP